MREHRVGFLVQYMPFLQAMLPAILEEKRRNITCDVIVPPIPAGEADFLHASRGVIIDTLEGMGIPVLRDYPDKLRYDVLYSAYPFFPQPLPSPDEIRYHVRYNYGVTGGNKADTHYPQNIFNYYDYILCLSEPDASIFSAHAKPVQVGNIKLANYSRTRQTPKGKKTLLYLPTWGAHGSVRKNTVQKLLELRDKYHIVTKAHTHLAYSAKEKSRNDLMHQFDKCYDANMPVADILNDADVVLSDLSSAAFDAVAGDVPLALFGLGGPLYCGEGLCLHQQLVRDDIIPGTNDPSELEAVIERASSPAYFAKQQALKKDIFPYEGTECLDALMRFQSDLFADRVDLWYVNARRAVKQNYIKEQLHLQQQLAALRQDVVTTRQACEATVAEAKLECEATAAKARLECEATAAEAKLECEATVAEAKLECEIAIKTLTRDFETSASWRLTRPLRTISDMLHGRDRGAS